MHEIAPPINEAVALLSRFAPSALLALKNDVPELGPHLEAGGIAGLADPQIVARAQVCLRTLAEVRSLSERGISHAQKRLARQKSLTLTGGITAAVASASVVTSLAASYPTFAFGSGAVSLVGSLMALLAEHVGKIPKSGMSLFDAYESLVQIRADAFILEGELQTMLDHDPQEEDEKVIAKLIGQGNASFRKTHEVFSVLELAFK